AGGHDDDGLGSLLHGVGRYTTGQCLRTGNRRTVRPIHAFFTTAQTAGSRPRPITPAGSHFRSPRENRTMRTSSLCLAALALGLATAPLHAQVPVHKHYQPTDSFDTAAPSGARAPRLQKVGKHVFPVSTRPELAPP